jgi:hypothetical protein
MKHCIEKISAIPLTTQRFKCIFINRMTLMDSTAFLPSSLDELARTLTVSDHHFPILRQWSEVAGEEYEEAREEKLKAATRKGIFPYDHVTGGDAQLKAEKCLPPREAFFNRLTNEGVSPRDYAFAGQVWNLFDCGSMMDYCRVYMETDVYLLAEAVMTMRKTLFEEFELDMLQYLSLPMMAKDIMLKVTDAEIELISDYDMIMMLQRGIRGGLSFIGQRSVELDAEPALVPLKKDEYDDDDDDSSDGGGGGGEREQVKEEKERDEEDEEEEEEEDEGNGR